MTSPSKTSRTFVVSTLAPDPDLYGVGASASLGDNASDRLFVPQFRPLTTVERGDPLLSVPRFLFVLCGLDVGVGERLLVHAVKVGGDIAQASPVRITNADGDIIDEWTHVDVCDLRSPGSPFQDGNVVFGLRVEEITSEVTPPVSPEVPSAVPGAVRGFGGVDSALLYAEFDPASERYIPPGNGVFPGRALGGLGTIRSVTNGWMDPDEGVIEVVGPCRVRLFASVLQTDPINRPYLPQGQQPDNNSWGGLRPETQYVYAWGDPPYNKVRFRHVTGSLRVSLVEEPSCP